MLRTFTGALITWLLPMLLSFGLYDPETKIYVPSYIGFKITMALTAATVAFLTMRWISKKELVSAKVPAIYVAVNSLLDIFVLVLLFAMPFMFWTMTVFPIYVVVFCVTFYFFNNTAPRK
jgi:hypothetical protein